MAKTAKQVISEQKIDAKRNQQLTTLRTTTAVPAAHDNRDFRQQFLDRIAPTGIVGRLVQFNGKDGRFVYDDTGETIGADEDFVVLADQTLTSFIKFMDEGPPLRVGGLFYAKGFELPPRDQLGDTNPAQWPLGLSGRAEDPWQIEMLLVLKRPATQELLTFATRSKTGKRAVGNLLKHYDRLQISRPGAFPVVRLKPGGYQDSRYGFVHTPNFPVTGTTPGHTPEVPDTSTGGQLNDLIPF